MVSNAKIDLFLNRNAHLPGINALLFAELTTSENAIRLMEIAVQRQDQGISYNCLPAKCRVVRAAIENFCEQDAENFARRLLVPHWRCDWRYALSCFKEIQSKNEAI